MRVNELIVENAINLKKPGMLTYSCGSCGERMNISFLKNNQRAESKARDYLEKAVNTHLFDNCK